VKTFLNAGGGLPRSPWLFILGVFLACAGGVASAQTDEEESAAVDLIDSDEDEIEEITVTGSRLKRNTFTSVSPLQVVDGETARDLGLIDAQDILTNTTVISGQQNTVGVSTAFNGFLQQAFTTIGNSMPSLRGLGSSVTGRARTLILINGRRLGPIGVGGAPANPDVSMIPGSLIERTEILLDGASSVYGSDAVAGVINYIMRRDFDGVEISAQTSESRHGWGGNDVISIATGIDGDRGYVSFAAEMSRRDHVTQGDVIRDIWGPTDGVNCQTSIGEYDNGRIVEVCDGHLPGQFIVTAAIGTVIGTNPGGLDPVPGAPGFYVRPGNYFWPSNDPNIRAIVQEEGRTYLPKTDRTSFFLTGEYNLNQNHDFFFEGMFANRELFSTAWGQEVLPVAADTPFNPFGSGGLIVVPVERSVWQEIDVSRFVAGVRGDLPGITFGDSWSYEVFGSAHRSTGFQNRGPYYHEERLTAGLNGTTDAEGNVTCTNPTGANFFGFDQNRSPLACVPLNPFTPEFLRTGRFPTQAMNDYAFGFAGVQTRVEQEIFGGFITGDLFSFPKGGPMQVLLGVEGRNDDVRTTPSDNLRLGLLAGLDADLGANGGRWIKEIYGEVAFPILQGQRFAESLTLEGAVRWTEEEFSGDDTTYQVKLEYAPTDYLSFRGGFGTSFRAPDTGEQFGTGTVFVQTSRIDPCIVSSLQINPLTNTYDPALETREQVVLDNCVALGIDPTSYGTVGMGTPVLAFTSLPVAFGNFGFKEVQPETSEAWFAGLTFDQPWTDAFDFSIAVTWFDYVVDGSIGQLTRSQILSDCFASVGLTDPLCAFQERDPNNGQLVSVNEASINLGPTTSHGYDVNMRIDYELDQFDLANSIDLTWDVLYTHSKENTEDILGLNEEDNLLGTIGVGGGFPEDQLVSTFNVGYGDFNAIWRLRWINGMWGTPDLGNTFDPCFDFDAGALDPNCTEKEYTDDYLQSDLYGVYRGRNWLVRLGVTNLFDEVQKIDEDIALANVAIQSGHDIYGRRVTLGFEVQF
jgi:iron complex outermembrane receptor protein